MNTRPIRCLIVEDKEDDRDYLVDLVSQNAPFLMEVVGVCDTIDEAKRLYKQKAPDLIFLDNQLPGGTSGLDFLEEVKALNDHLVPVVLTTAYPPTAGHLSELQAVGRVLVLQKPFDAHHFQKMLTNLPPLSKEAFELPSWPRKAVFVSVSVKDADRTNIKQMINMKDILFVSSDGNLKDIFMKTDKKYNERMKFDPFINYGFRQIYKSHYVNFRATEYVQFSFKSETRKLIIKNLLTNKEYRLGVYQEFTEKTLLRYLMEDAPV
jgi:CheY-like chemotaxis protein